VLYQAEPLPDVKKKRTITVGFAKTATEIIAFTFFIS
jgi:hypothetical protein